MEPTPRKAGQGSMASYVIGFILSIVLTLVAYLLVVNHVFSGWAIFIAVSLLAVVQLAVQLLFFLHLGRESNPRWNLVVFLFMLVVIVIVAGGSLWIMNNLDYHHMTMSPQQTDQFIIKDEGIQE